MAKRYLLASGDQAVVRTVSRAISELEAEADVCPSVMEAFAMLPRRNYDGLIVDCDDMELVGQMLRGLRANSDIAHAIVIALVPSSEGIKAAFSAGANFALNKPVTIMQIERSLRASHGLIFRATAEIR
jgi:DNA-binding response OmpR family regulator